MKIPKIACVVISLIIIFNSILALWICYSQAYNTNIKTIASQLQQLKHNLQKNYIHNLRVIDHQSICNQNEQVVEGLISDNKKEYKLQYLVVEDQNNQNQVIQICQEIHFNNSFASSLKNPSNKDQEKQHQCEYKGIKLSPNNQNLCPISNILFSLEESIEGYEKIPIDGNTKTKLFVQRNRIDSSPLVGITLVKQGDLPFLHSSGNLSYNMESICKEKYMSYEGLCQFESNPNLFKLQIIQENQYPMDQECSQLEVLNFNQVNLYFTSYNLKMIDFTLAMLIFGFNVILVITPLVIVFNKVIYLDSLTQYVKWSLVNLLYYYLIRHDYGHINSVIENNCFYTEDLFDKFYNQSKELYNYLDFYFLLQAFLILLTIVLGLCSSKQKEEQKESGNKFTRIGEEEMTFTN
ncbi:MHCK/EF2 kinase domain protein, putative (macronuclear) [Tetrahymena thermophila SB210]|uniref:MHCK/EF2 kinase domain protein, putative n=1 Tax=Tetrahymena thermophila (strain SB210) TaxID=312017 RepID=W7WW52_TETTS|nr:MHCK/EF2 kinase domain protein, putative [Tetrahymena thermophila SB210]EWS71065.1 MHCK/EF2 kinase domain protein, putative [Tetrahymena thermophila SB210]|eukprot:XP_012656406.1 MHCK/EF2 kinase domain protein, putative [Tetrahymena thermophila SB210]